MALKEKHKLEGRLFIFLHDLTDRPVGRYKIDNLITNRGRNLLATFLAGQIEGLSQLTIAVGSGDDTPMTTDTALNKQVAEAKIIKDHISTELNDDEVKITLRATLPPAEQGEEQSLQEAGIVIGLTDGTRVLYNRTVFPVITRTDSLKISLSWELLF
ncbi:MAG: hypothetical protein OEV42_04585 [Deltaproteobacteria bacterium]|nr:hypothetical protein [Deltaproteobacteria bacterium]